MYNILILNREYQVIGIIDSYESLIWRPSYSEIGDFELYLAATSEHVELLQADNYLVRDIDVNVIDSSRQTFNNVMIIKNITVSTSLEEGDYLTITGRELKYVLHNRIVWNMTTLSGTVGQAIEKLLTENIVDPVNINRRVANFYIDQSVGDILDPIDMQVTGDYLDEVISSICQTYDVGYEVSIVTGSESGLVFRAYRGVNRSINQRLVPYVIFSEDFDNLYNSEYQLESEDYGNVALIGGEGEGAERTYATLYDSEFSGLDRYEIFVDARDVSSNLEDDKTMSPAEYNALLQGRGLEKLAEVTITEGFSGELKTNGSFTYNRDFWLGDVVTVVNKYGIGRDVRVLSAIESYDEDGEKLIPEFNI